MKQWQRREQWLKSLKPGQYIPHDKRKEPSHFGDVVSTVIVLVLWIMVFTA